MKLHQDRDAFEALISDCQSKNGHTKQHRRERLLSYIASMGNGGKAGDAPGDPGQQYWTRSNENLRSSS